MEHFQQSPQWREVKNQLGNKCVPVGKYFFQTTKLPLISKFVGYLPKANLSGINFEELINIARLNNCISIQIDPNNLYSDSVSHYLKVNKYRICEPVALQHNVVLDISKSEEELLNNLKQKHRYNIKVAQKHNVSIEFDQDTKSFEDFYKLYLATSKRQSYAGRSYKYLKTVWDNFSNKAFIVKGSVDGELVVTWFVLAYHDTLYYVYGGSSDLHKNTMPAYGLVWQLILWGKQNNYKYIDFMGIKDPSKEENLNDGFTRFKLGWGGDYVKYADSFEIIINPFFYYIYSFAKSVRYILKKIKFMIR